MLTFVLRLDGVRVAPHRSVSASFYQQCSPLSLGPVEDPDCSAPDRSSGFESYFCVCESGWVGENCETDYDECQSTPCEYPYVCYDHLNTYECACPLSDPLCDGLHWRSVLNIDFGVVFCHVGDS